jgi:hypothetical protein
VHQRSRGRRRPPAPRSPEQKLHGSPGAIQFLPQSSPEGGPPYRRSGGHRPPSRSMTCTPQEEDTRSRSRQGRLPARAFPRVRADNDGHRPTVHRLHRRLPSHGGRQDLSRLCDPYSSARQSTTGLRANTHGQPLADTRLAHGQGRRGYGTMHVADATGYRWCFCVFLFSFFAILNLSSWQFGLHIRLHVLHIQLHVGCCRHCHERRASGSRSQPSQRPDTCRHGQGRREAGATRRPGTCRHMSGATGHPDKPIALPPAGRVGSVGQHEQPVAPTPAGMAQSVGQPEPPVATPRHMPAGSRATGGRSHPSPRHLPAWPGATGGRSRLTP